MMAGDLLTLPLDELVVVACNALKEKDLPRLRELNTAFHHRFFHELRRGNEASRTEFIRGMLAVLESAGAKQLEHLEELPELLTRWAHLDELMDAVRGDVDAVERAREFLGSREHGNALLHQVTEAGAQGIRAGDLAQRLGISPQNLAKLLREFEAADIVERHRVGKNTYVCLGLTGQLLAGRQEPDQPREIPRFPPSSPVYFPVNCQPRDLWSVQ